MLQFLYLFYFYTIHFAYTCMELLVFRKYIWFNLENKTITEGSKK